MTTTTKNISGWGNFPVIKATVLRPDTIAELVQLVKEVPSLLPRGSGRSYGDSSLYHTVVDMKGLNKILVERDGFIKVEGGITIAELLQHIVPQKKFLPVTPGIKSITIGGAIASDVHGKNHLYEGSFFNATHSLQLINEQGEIITCSRTENTEIFGRTFGSMGLCGIIITATIKLINIETTWIQEDQFSAVSFSKIFLLMEAKRKMPFMATWIDLLSKETRGIIKTGGWITDQSNLAGRAPMILETGKQKTVPFRLPCPLPAFAFKCFNSFFFNKAKKIPAQIVHFNNFFYPLDSIKNWNHVYGPNGMLQFHFALPLKASERGMEKAIEIVKCSKATCTLAVMKIFGKENTETPFSFPIEGYNLALDFINNKKAIALIGNLDLFVKTLGGKVYKTKDAVSSLPQQISSSSKFNSVQNERYGR